jgi:hypothetical protein
MYKAKWVGWRVERGKTYGVTVKFSTTDRIISCIMVLPIHPITHLMVGYVYTLNTIQNVKYKVKKSFIFSNYAPAISLNSNIVLSQALPKPPRDFPSTGRVMAGNIT